MTNVMPSENPPLRKSMVGDRLPRCLSSAFTLIELLVVIGIIVILLLIALPVSGKIRESAANIRCIGQLQQIGNSFFSYAADHNGSFPTLWKMENGYRVNWNYFLAPYVGIKEGQEISLSPEAMSCPAKSSFDLPYSAYSVNYNIVISLEEGQSGVPWIDTGAKRLTSNIDRGTFIVADGQGLQVNSPVHWKISTDYDGDGVADSFSGIPFNGLDFRHVGKANFFLRDGSVVSLTSRQWAANENNIWGVPQD